MTDTTRPDGQELRLAHFEAFCKKRGYRDDHSGPIYDAWIEASRAALARPAQQTGETPAAGQDCPHAAPFRYCERCAVTPCPIGLDNGKDDAHGC